jgi:hypothetical protein
MADPLRTPDFPASTENWNGGDNPYASNGSVYVAMDRLRYGAAITSLIYRNKQYVANVPPLSTGSRGLSLTCLAMFGSQAVSSDPVYSSELYNATECGTYRWNAAGELFNPTVYPMTSPTLLRNHNDVTIRSRAQAVWWCQPGNSKVVNGVKVPDYTLPGQRVAPVYFGKTVSVGYVGNTQTQGAFSNVVSFDVVVNLPTPDLITAQEDKNLIPAKILMFSTQNHNYDCRIFKYYYTYDPRPTSKMLTPVTARDASNNLDASINYGSLPIIVSDTSQLNSGNAICMYSPQMPLSGTSGTPGSSVIGTWTYFSASGAGEIDCQYRRSASTPAGNYAFKTWMIVGTVTEIKNTIDALYADYTSALEPSVFTASVYKTNGGIGIDESQLRLDYLVRGRALNIKAH